MSSFLYELAAGSDQVAALAALLSIYAAAAVLSGLSGFGFSAIGCLSFAVLPPERAVAMLMALSLVTQASGAAALRSDLRRYMLPLRRPDGVVPYLVGGVAGLPFGLALLSGLEIGELKAGLGGMLIGFATWSLVQAPRAAATAPTPTTSMPPAARSPSLPPTTAARRTPPPNAARSFIVGAAGGLVGGFSAFPGAALVVWNAIAGVGKEQGRALTQAFILAMQVVGLALLLARHSALFGAGFWALFITAAPLALVGNRIGIAIYKRSGSVAYRRVTLYALGAAGMGLLVQLALQ